MSIPLDRLYHYIESVAKNIRKGNVVIYHFYPHGSKNIENLVWFRYYDTITEFTSPELIFYDQEPLNFDLYTNVLSTPGPQFLNMFKNFNHNIFPKRNLRYRLGNIYDKCLIFHSEQRSIEVQKYCNNGFIPVYYWSHGVIARDWFRYAEFYTPTTYEYNKTKFLIYNRSWSNTREYRLKFADLLVENNLVGVCQTSFNAIEPETKIHYSNHVFQNELWKPKYQVEKYISSTTASSCSSADFDINDYDSCNFEVVLETIFDDSRIHLTEKSLRPIACGRPFILVATHGSLEYLRHYGFKTFADVFDEAYDTVVDPVQRMHNVIKTMKEINSWNEQQYQEKMKKIQEIVNFNKQHFFSQKFQSQVFNELHDNLEQGLNELETTNTSAEYINIRKKYFKLPELALARKISRKENGNSAIITILKVARKYYNKHRNK